MTEKSDSHSKAQQVRPVFVIGTGRSGTHWLGHSLGDHPEVRSTIEEAPMFGWSTKLAMDISLETLLFPKLASEYQKQLKQTTKPLYLDKSHPNIWIADQLKQTFQNALFIGIERNPYATVASMLDHPNVLAWHRRWKEFPVPNRFLGISQEASYTYANLPLATQCSMRWIAHHNKMQDLKKTLNEDLLLIKYETFAKDTGNVTSHLQHFLKLKERIPVPEVKTSSLSKWKERLSEEQIQQIQDTVGFSPSDCV